MKLSCADLLENGSVAPACLPRGGTIPNGGSCNSNWQCATGRCFVSPNFTDGIHDCGTCVPVVPLGQTCDPNSLLGAACADGLVCGGLSDQRLLRRDHPPLRAASRHRSGLRFHHDLLLRSDQGRGVVRRHDLAVHAHYRGKSGRLLRPVEPRHVRVVHRLLRHARRRRAGRGVRHLQSLRFRRTTVHRLRCLLPRHLLHRRHLYRPRLRWSCLVGKRRRHERGTALPQRLRAAKPHPRAGRADRAGLLAAALTRSGVI
jgi:hypothetical protein